MNSPYVKNTVNKIKGLYQHQSEYLQVVDELIDYSDIDEELTQALEQNNGLERLLQPDRIISFQVAWLDDNNQVQVNQGWRVQHANLIGPYKGGLRFHPSVNESVLKFLALEQTFKNALTGLPIGGAKGGANFDPKGKSSREIMRFCQAFMTELYRHIGPNTDVPAGDINVGTREIGYLFGQYRRLQNQFSGALTGKELDFGGSQVRVESTGYGVVYFIENVLERFQQKLSNMSLAISGCGNVALHVAEKAIEQGAKVVTLSNSDGCLSREQGLSAKLVAQLLQSKERPNLKEVAKQFGAKWHQGAKPWQQNVDIAVPCATQNELNGDDAKVLLTNKVQYIFEGANMPCTSDAVALFEQSNSIFSPAKVVNCGGVIASAFEMGQNAMFYPESYQTVDEKLKKTMRQIHTHCMENNESSYLIGANSFALKKLIHVMNLQGV
ncbi:NADP-specific glutamate dehydrogenase [Thalassotalea marina]|uniref:Glutamate dehydrogenase n=1 Tax=Thalassotalea marina TaxID=1673741 RepID=A0A919ENJ9_9GAMM|nr:NADP-specific glutamate dehydrogenase [Thalassotalea marina]GHG05115.1 glutamate dehydrogenase [Thalassotalea marina]